jgi:hypothetical protein
LKTCNLYRFPYFFTFSNNFLDAQIADGIRVNVVTNLSSRHHTDTWVDAGYIKADKFPMFHSKVIDDIMNYVTIKLGDYEVNYGDAHFRRTLNGNAIYNPFIGNYIMDAFSTEIGGEADVNYNGLIGMVGFSNGESSGSLLQPGKRSIAYLMKLGFDKQVNTDLRVRLTGSLYSHDRAISNVLYQGDRAGSRYYLVMEYQTDPSVVAWSGQYNPGFSSKCNAFMINPFVKYQGLEFFGTIEYSIGYALGETKTRIARNQVGELVYRFGQSENVYVGARYEKVSGKLIISPSEVGTDRVQLAAGWFLTHNMLLKYEYVTQWYHNYPMTSILSGGRFRGFMVEAAVGF